MCFFDSDNNDFLGGLFDLDGDGKTSLFEQGLAYAAFEEATKDSEQDDEDGDETDL